MAEKIPTVPKPLSDGLATAALGLTLRPATGSDEALVRRIFAESHCSGFELLGMESTALDSLIQLQFQARQAQYRTDPDAVEYLICRGAGPDADVLGSCWLSDTAERLRVLDIAVLSEHRRRGIARSVLGELCARAAAAGTTVGLSVWHENAPARELYRALGFVPDPAVAGDQSGEPGDLGNGYLELRYFPSDAPYAAAQHAAGPR